MSEETIYISRETLRDKLGTPFEGGYYIPPGVKRAIEIEFFGPKKPKEFALWIRGDELRSHVDVTQQSQWGAIRVREVLDEK